jgi:hypothetical protein
MKPQLKSVVLTAIVTTLAWALVIAAFFWWGFKKPSGNERVLMEFLEQPGALGTFEMRNPKTQDVLVVIEQLPTGGIEKGRVQLGRHRLSALGRMRIGVREISEDRK